MEIITGIYKDTYTDEDGKKVPYEDKVVGVLEGEEFHVVSIPDFMTWREPKEEFLAKVTGIKKGAEIWS